MLSGPTAHPTDQAKRLEIDTITDAYGMVAKVHYDGTAIGGRYPINKIEIKDGVGGAVLTTLDYAFTGNNLDQCHPYDRQFNR